MKSVLCISGLSLALALSAPLTAQAAKPSKHSNDCPPSATITREHGVTVYRAAPRPWRQQAAREARAAAPARRVAIVVRPYRYNYLSVDTRSRGEWGPVNAVYQKF